MKKLFTVIFVCGLALFYLPLPSSASTIYAFSSSSAQYFEGDIFSLDFEPPMDFSNLVFSISISPGSTNAAQGDFWEAWNTPSGDRLWFQISIGAVPIQTYYFGGFDLLPAYGVTTALISSDPFAYAYGDGAIHIAIWSEVTDNSKEYWTHGEGIFSVGSASEVPLPGAVWLLTSGLIGLAGLKKSLMK